MNIIFMNSTALEIDKTDKLISTSIKCQDFFYEFKNELKERKIK